MSTLPARAALTAACLLVATLLWLPILSLALRPDPRDLVTRAPGPRASALLARQLAAWEDPALRASDLGPMLDANPEWDFMGRTYLVMSLANVALADPAQAQRHLAVIDAILEDTQRLEAERGKERFLLPYARRAPFRSPQARSLFVDGELLMMLAARALVRPDERHGAALRERAAIVAASLGEGPVLSAESYPDECWTFCNTFALAALRAADAASGSDHSALGRRWVATARERLVDPRTGMLVSSYTWDGEHLDGPEGSSIFMAAHNLLVVDEAFAREQLALARRHLYREAMGFGWAREWPSSWPGPDDVDSGPTIPLLGASAGASGLAILGASAARDDAMLASLLRSVDLAAFPTEDEHGLRLAAGNQVGDAVFLYALTYGPLWERVAGGAS